MKLWDRLPDEVKKAFNLAGMVNKEVKKEKLIIYTERVGIIPEALNMNGMFEDWSIDYIMDERVIQWIIRI